MCKGPGYHFPIMKVFFIGSHINILTLFPYWAALSLSFRLISILLFMNIKAWGPRVIELQTTALNIIPVDICFQISDFF